MPTLCDALNSHTHVLYRCIDERRGPPPAVAADDVTGAWRGGSRGRGGAAIEDAAVDPGSGNWRLTRTGSGRAAEMLRKRWRMVEVAKRASAGRYLWAGFIRSREVYRKVQNARCRRVKEGRVK